MSRENAPYKLELTEEEFHELRHILRACDYFHQIGVMYNHVQHLDRLFEEASREVNDYHMKEARELVEYFYDALRKQQTEKRLFDSFDPLSLYPPKIRLACSRELFNNQKAAEFLRQNIPEGMVEWLFIPEPVFDLNNNTISNSESRMRDRYVDWMLNREEFLNIVSDQEQIGFFRK